MIFTMPEMDQYQRKHLIRDQNMAIAKNMSSTIQIIDHRLICANVHHDIYVRLKSSLNYQVHINHNMV